MKYLVVLALCVTTFAFAEEFEDYQAACLTENNLKKADLRDENKIKNTCYYVCIYKKIGMMRQDGTYDLEDMLGDPPTPEKREEGIKEISNAIRECKAQVGTDICKLTHCVQTTLA